MPVRLGSESLDGFNRNRRPPSSESALRCANHVERGICGNRRSLLRDRLLERVLAGLKQRLLAPELVEEFVRTYVAEVNAANRARGARQASLTQEQKKLERQVRNLLELIKDGHGSAAMVNELRALEQRQDILTAEIAAAGEPEPVPVLHPNLPELYRRKVEALQLALREPATAAAATEALRTLIDAILVFPGEKRGEVTVQLRGDLAAFLHLAETPRADPGAHSKTAVLLVGNGRSGGVVGSLVAGARCHLYRTRFAAFRARPASSQPPLL